MKDWKPAKCFPELQLHIDMTTEPVEQENSKEIQVKPNEDQTLNDRTEENKETSEKNVDESFMEDLSYYYAEGATPVGPLSLKALVQANVNSDTLIWKVGMKNWKPARCFPEIQSYIKKEFTLVE